MTQAFRRLTHRPSLAVSNDYIPEQARDQVPSSHTDRFRAENLGHAWGPAHRIGVACLPRPWAVGRNCIALNHAGSEPVDRYNPQREGYVALLVYCRGAEGVHYRLASLARCEVSDWG